jgi:hypothetical protein
MAKGSNLPANQMTIVAAPESPIKFKTNFAAAKASLSKRVAKYKGLKVTDENMEECKAVLKECVSTRTMLDATEKETIKLYIDAPKNTLKLGFTELRGIVGELEAALSEQFDVYEAERHEELTAVFNMYIKTFQEEFNLDQEFLDVIELRKSYYNKTAKESETRADIRAQFEEGKKAQQTKADDVNLVKTLCAGNVLLNVDQWVKQLEYRAASSVAADIQSEIARLSVVTAPVVPAAPVKVSAGVSIGLSTKAKKSEVTVTIKYSKKSAVKLRDFFESNPDVEVNFEEW